MFIRPCYRTKNGKRHAYWALMESYRTERGPRQRIVAYLGQLDESHRLGVKNNSSTIRGHTGSKSMSNACEWKTAATLAGLGWDCNSSNN